CYVHYLVSYLLTLVFLFFFTAPSPTEIYTLSLHDALPIFGEQPLGLHDQLRSFVNRTAEVGTPSPLVTSDTSAPSTCEVSLVTRDRKSTRLNSSHSQISYAVFCLKKKKKK